MTNINQTMSGEGRHRHTALFNCGTTTITTLRIARTNLHLNVTRTESLNYRHKPLIVPYFTAERESFQDLGMTANSITQNTFEINTFTFTTYDHHHSATFFCRITPICNNHQNAAVTLMQTKSHSKLKSLAIDCIRLFMYRTSLDCSLTNLPEAAEQIDCISEESYLKNWILLFCPVDPNNDTIQYERRV